MAAMQAGGLPESKYSTVYAILRRREKQVGDIINMKGDWALQEWYPNYRKKSSTSENEDEETKETADTKEEESATA